VRADTDDEMAAWCQENGLEVIVQMPDHFNKGHPTEPGEYARRSHNILESFIPYSHVAVLDNEPNLPADRCGNWWAERFTRWYRAVAACFRFQDDAGHWRLIMPGLCCAPNRNIDYWLHVGRENYLESDAASAHCYWQNPNQMADPYYGRQYELVRRLYPTKPVYVLEYGNSSPYAGDFDKEVEYKSFVAGLPHYVPAAHLFILGGTETWKHFHLTHRVAEALGRLRET